MYVLIGTTLYAVLTLTNKFIKNMNRLELWLHNCFIIDTFDSLSVYSWREIRAISVVRQFRYPYFNTRCPSCRCGILFIFYRNERAWWSKYCCTKLCRPLTSLLISVLLIGESMTLTQILGAILLLGSTFISEVDLKMKSL